MNPPFRLGRRRLLFRVLLPVAAVLVVVALLVLEPWKLVVDRRVDEPLPTVLAVAVPVDPGAAAAPGAVPDPSPVVIARGRLVSHEHASSGEAVVLRLADGSRVLRLQDLDTSDGPRLRVWLSAAPVLEGSAGWYVFADAPHLDLGDLKGNVGNSNYPLPADADLTALPSVTIWCARFSVSFAATALEAVV
jgi:Electron transfer DM13